MVGMRKYPRVGGGVGGTSVVTKNPTQHSPSHLGALNSDHKFQSLLQKCMSGCDSEEEFESTWKEMMSKHNGHKWLGYMYKIRHKWSTLIAKKYFRLVLSKTISLTQFFNIFEKMVKRWRQLEGEKDFKCSLSL
ncbi:hypothetical protein Lal_00031941 [Lupinus albus]|nr:hypothetical protein Lal_00031941 [Lupinus albus]